MKLLTLFIISLMLFSCSGKKEDNTLTLGLIKGITSLDPAMAFDGKSLKLIAQSYEPLYQYHYQIRPFKIIPLLAEGMPQWNGERTSLTIKIKKGIRYHDHPLFEGKKRYVVAQDFINQLKRLAFKPLNSPGYGFFNIIKGLEEFSKTVGNNVLLFAKTPISGAKAVDDYTLRFDLKRKSPNFIWSSVT